MYLDRAQEGDLHGERGEAVQWAMEVLVRKGDHAGAKRLIPVSSVHIPDWYRHRWSEDWDRLVPMNGSLGLPVTANPGGLDDVPSIRRKATLSALRPHLSYAFSCTPYLAGNHPVRGSTAAWGGRSTVAFVNSILGARSNAEDFSSAVASAITGLTAERGLLLDENRQPTMAVMIAGDAGNDLGFLGHHLSTMVRGQVPVIFGLRPDYDAARGFALAINHEGRVPLFHLRNGKPPAGIERIEVGASEWRGSVQDREHPDLLIFGCPHLSEQEINRWGRYLAGHRRRRTEAWFFSSKLCLDKCPLTGALLESRGRVLADRCPLGMVKEIVGRVVGCDSPALASCLSSAGIDAIALPHDELSNLLASD